MRRLSLFLAGSALAVVALLIHSWQPTQPGADELEPSPAAGEKSVPIAFERGQLERQPVIPGVDPAGSNEDGDPESSLVEAHDRIEVVDPSGAPLPGAVAIVESDPGSRIGFPADGRGWIALPPEMGTRTLTVAAPGHHPETLRGVHGQVPVVLSPGMHVQVQVTTGWQRLTEGFPGTSIEDGFGARLEPPRVSGSDPFEEPDVPTVELRLPDGTTRDIALGDLHDQLESALSPEGLASFLVLEPGEYGFDVTFVLVPDWTSDRRYHSTFRARPEVVVRPGEAEQYFRVQLPEYVLDRCLEVFEQESGGGGD